MRKQKNNAIRIKRGWIFLSVISIFIFFGLYYNRPLSYEQAVIKANQYQQQGLYCSGYRIQRDGICETVFRDKKTDFEKATIDVVDLETAKRIDNEYNK